MELIERKTEKIRVVPVRATNVRQCKVMVNNIDINYQNSALVVTEYSVYFGGLGFVPWVAQIEQSVASDSPPLRYIFVVRSCVTQALSHGAPALVARFGM